MSRKTKPRSYDTLSADLMIKLFTFVTLLVESFCFVLCSKMFPQLLHIRSCYTTITDELSKTISDVCTVGVVSCCKVDLKSGTSELYVCSINLELL